ncbi:unnamed protein product [Durusdinium trenchii]|uniref:ABC1 atypical kinase-like domain-containing protein n=1 Tax=Durusdinium trenchii TaxID=1381693 RepID=A0ABP0KY91_9DINO
MCSSNGGIFVKMGQHAATLAPAVPAEYVERLAQLQDRAPESTWAEVLEVLNTELPGGTTASLDFDAAPVGSASLAQVHRAERRGTEREGAEVAVKVQHPNIQAGSRRRMEGLVPG